MDVGEGLASFSIDKEIAKEIKKKGRRKMKEVAKAKTDLKARHARNDSETRKRPTQKKYERVEEELNSGMKVLMSAQKKLHKLTQANWSYRVEPMPSKRKTKGAEAAGGETLERRFFYRARSTGSMPGLIEVIKNKYGKQSATSTSTSSLLNPLPNTSTPPVQFFSQAKSLATPEATEQCANDSRLTVQNYTRLIDFIVFRAVAARNPTTEPKNTSSSSFSSSTSSSSFFSSSSSSSSSSPPSSSSDATSRQLNLEMAPLLSRLDALIDSKTTHPTIKNLNKSYKGQLNSWRRSGLLQPWHDSELEMQLDRGEGGDESGESEWEDETETEGWGRGGEMGIGMGGVGRRRINMEDVEMEE